jgi:AraC-like DNA-binding protein
MALLPVSIAKPPKCRLGLRGPPFEDAERACKSRQWCYFNLKTIYKEGNKMTSANVMNQRTASLESFQATMSGLLRPCRIKRRSSNAYDTEVLHGRIRPFGLTVLRIGGHARIEVEAHDDMTLLQVPLNGSFISRSRHAESTVYRSAQNAQLIDARSPLDLEFSPTTRMMIFNLGGEQIDLLGGETLWKRYTQHSRVIPMDTKPGRFFYQLCQSAARKLESAQQTAFEDDFARNIEYRLFASLTSAFDEVTNKNDKPGGVPCHVKRAEKFMMEHLHEPLSLDAIVQAAGTSARTLHRTFKNVRGDSPLGILKNMRLEKVHHELSRGVCAPGDITRIAMSWGFNHMGLFAADYRNRYGSTPSSAARKTQG